MTSRPGGGAGLPPPAVVFLPLNDRGMDAGFTVHGLPYEALIAADGGSFSLASRDARTGQSEDGPIRVVFAGAAGRTSARGEQDLGGLAHHLYGSDPSRWRRHLSRFGRVLVKELYPGIDVIFYGRGQSIEYDFVVAPGADPSRIALEISGADSIELTANGDLTLTRGASTFIHRAPVVLQDRDGRRDRVGSRYVMRGKARIGIELDTFDRRAPLVIDPVIELTTAFEVARRTEPPALALDRNGDIYVCMPGFLYKLRADLSFIWSVYLPVTCSSLAVDRDGSPVLVGSTFLLDLPVRRALNSTGEADPNNLFFHCEGRFGVGSCTDAFVLKLTPAGDDVVFATYWGVANRMDQGLDVAVGPDRAIAVVGSTTAREFPTTAGALKETYNAARLLPNNTTRALDDGFLSIFEPDGRLRGSTFLGGPAGAVAVDPAGDVVVGVDGHPRDVPWPTPLDYGSDNVVWAYLAKLSGTGQQLLFSRFLVATKVVDVATDSTGALYAVAESATGLSPMVNALQRAVSSHDSYVAKFSSEGTLVYASGLGGSQDSEQLTRLAVDQYGSAYVTGATSSIDFPQVNAPGWPRKQSTTPEAFLTKIGAGGGLVYSGVLPGDPLPTGHGGLGVTVSPDGTAYVLNYSSTVSANRLTKVAHPVDAPTPILTSIAPVTATSGGGTRVQVHGSQFQDGVHIMVGGQAAWQVVRYSAELLDVVLPAGSGAAAVVAINPNGRASTESVTVSYSPAARCNVTTADSLLIVPAAGISRTIDVSREPSACTWHAWSDVSWLTAQATGSGSAIAIAVAPNGGPPRTGRIRIGAREIVVVQTVWPCAITVTPPALSVGAHESAATLRVEPTPGCYLSFNSFSPDWLRPTQASVADPFRDGNGVTRLSFSANMTGVARQGIIDISAAPFGRSRAESTLLPTRKLVPVSQAATTAACPVQIRPSTVSVPPIGASLRFEIDAPAECSWTAGSSSGMVTFGQITSGSGSGSLEVRVLPHGGATPRSGTVRVGSQVVTIAQDAECAVNLLWSQGTVPASGGTGTVGVATNNSGCSWSVTSEASWLAVTKQPTYVSFDAARNQTGSSRSGVLRIAGRAFTVMQPGDASCIPELSAATGTAAASGGAQAVGVMLASGCAWTSGSDVPWLVVSPASGIGSGTISIDVAANASQDARTGSVTVANRVYTLTQAGAAVGCAAALPATAATFPRTASSGRIQVVAPSACTWTATSTAPWIALTSASSMSGNATVTFDVAAHAGTAPRSAIISVANQAFLVTQGGSAQLTKVSVRSDGTEMPPPAGNLWAGSTAVSGDARIVAFLSGMPLTDTAFSNRTMAFVRDRSTGTLEVVSRSPNGVAADSTVYSVAMSANGRHVAFDTTAGNLVPGVNDNLVHVFVYDRVTRVLTHVGQGSDPSLSADGRIVAYYRYERATATTGESILIADRDADGDGRFDEPGDTRTERIGSNGYGWLVGWQPATSHDGQHVAFVSTSPGAVLRGPGPAAQQVYVLDRRSGRLAMVSVASDRTAGNGASGKPSLSANGRFVAFESSATNLVALDANGTNPDVYVHDRDADEDGVFDEPGSVRTILASLNAEGQQVYATSPRISGDGRTVAFAGSLGFFTFVYVRDLVTGRVEILNAEFGPGQSVVSWITQPRGIAVSPSGRWVSFAGGSGDSFVYDRLQSPPSQTIGRVEPPSGPTDGGAFVTIHGRDLWWHEAAFGGIASVQAEVVSPTQMRVRLPAHAPGMVDVTLRDAEGRATTVPAAFTYLSCVHTITPTAPLLSQQGDALVVNVQTTPGCTWTAETNDSWLTIVPPAAGTDSGAFSIAAEYNFSPQPRRATLRVGGRDIVVTQPGVSCVRTITPTELTVGPTGGRFSVQVAAASSCTWSRASSTPWLVLDATTDVSGNGTVTFTVSQNTEALRTGDLVVAGRRVVVRQLGLQTAPTVHRLKPNRGGNTGRVTVRLLGSDLLQDLSLRLRRAGEPDIVAPNTRVRADGRLARATFDLTGQSLGLWDLVLVQQNREFVFADQFTIEPGVAPRFSFVIDPPAQWIAGRPATVTVAFTNVGNIDHDAVPVWIGGLPAEAEVSLPPETVPGDEVSVVAGNTPRAEVENVPPGVVVDGAWRIGLVVGSVSPGQTGTVDLTVNLPSPREFELEVWETVSVPDDRTRWTDLACMNALTSLTVNAIGTALSVVPGASCAQKMLAALAAFAVDLPNSQYESALANAKDEPVVRSLDKLAYLAANNAIGLSGAVTDCTLGLFIPGSSFATFVGAWQVASSAIDVYEQCVAPRATVERYVKRVRIVRSTTNECNPSYTPLFLQFGPEGGTRDAFIDIGPGCPWDLRNSRIPDWLAVTPSFGTGPAVIRVFADPIPACAAYADRFHDFIFDGYPAPNLTLKQYNARTQPRVISRSGTFVVMTVFVPPYGYNRPGCGVAATSEAVSTALEPAAGTSVAGVVAMLNGASALVIEAQGANVYKLVFAAPPAGVPAELYVGTPDGGEIRETLPNALAASTDVDTDRDGLPDPWELQYGLDPSNPLDGEEDLDGDDRTNLEEYAAGTHPNARPAGIRYLAEGATGAFFDSRLSLANPDRFPASVQLRYLRSQGEAVTQWVQVPGQARVTIDPETLDGLQQAEFSTVVESDAPLVVDRTMTWDASGYGSHAETAVAAPGLRWYFAEGATHSGFDLFYLLQNPNTVPADVRVTYLLPSPLQPVVRHYTVGAQQRYNVWVDTEAGLAATDVSAIIEVQNGQPIIVERAMYLPGRQQLFGAGHDSAGIEAPGTEWFLAEGATGSFFDLFVLVANATDESADIEATFLLPDGSTVVKRYSVEGRSRFNIWVDTVDARLADTAVSTVIRSLNGVPVIVERAMWWPGPTAATWAEAHNSAGALASGTRWAVADGEVGGPRQQSTYLLVANPEPSAATVQVTLLFENGPPTSRDFVVAASSRLNIDVGFEFPEAQERRFGAIVESLGTSPVPIVVERAMYSNARGVFWAAGTNVLATRLR